MQIIEYIELPEEILCSCIAQSSDVEILNKIQDLMLDTAEYWDNGIPKYNEVSAECEGVEAKKQLLALLMLEYQKRMYKDDPHRMHLCEALLKTKS